MLTMVLCSARSKGLRWIFGLYRFPVIPQRKVLIWRGAAPGEHAPQNVFPFTLPNHKVFPLHAQPKAPQAMKLDDARSDTCDVACACAVLKVLLSAAIGLLVAHAFNTAVNLSRRQRQAYGKADDSRVSGRTASGTEERGRAPPTRAIDGESSRLPRKKVRFQEARAKRQRSKDCPQERLGCAVERKFTKDAPEDAQKCAACRKPKRDMVSFVGDGKDEDTGNHFLRSPQHRGPDSYESSYPSADSFNWHPFEKALVRSVPSGLTPSQARIQRQQRRGI